MFHLFHNRINNFVEVHVSLDLTRGLRGGEGVSIAAGLAVREKYVLSCKYNEKITLRKISKKANVF